MIGSDQQAKAGSADLRPYKGVRILDLTYRYGSYAGRLFADLGADVIRIEPPGGLPDRRELADGDEAALARFAFFNAGKQSVVIDLEHATGRARFDRLAAGSDIIFLERGGPLFDRLGELRMLNTSAVLTAISPFGITGPLADAPASDLVLQAAGGIAWMSGRIEDAPLGLPFEQATMVGSIYAATVTAIALVDAEDNGIGHLVEVSVQECIAHSLQNAIQVWDLEERIAIRGGEGTRDASEDVFPCADGFVFLASPLALGTSWKSLVAWMNEVGHPSGRALQEERWSDREWRLTRESREAFRRIFTAFTAELTRDELTREAIARRVVLGPVNRIGDLFADPQLTHRSFFIEIEGPGGNPLLFPGAPYRLSKPVWKATPAPELGEHNILLPETIDQAGPEHPSRTR